MKKTKLGLAIGTALVLAGCAGMPANMGASNMHAAKVDQAEFMKMMKASFSERGIAKMDRLEQDLGQSACSTGKDPSPELAKRVEAEAMKTLKWPADGNYFGDFAAGEKLAQGGRGMTWTDSTTDPKANGGNCYNCHQLSKEEISYGTIGPSLYNYGKIRGVTDLKDPAAKDVIEYTWGKMWNSKAYSACSNMPRFGHKGLLNEDQIRDLMALLLDPRSPVNR